jgi:hypothetical protein
MRIDELVGLVAVIAIVGLAAGILLVAFVLE